MARAVRTAYLAGLQLGRGFRVRQRVQSSCGRALPADAGRALLDGRLVPGFPRPTGSLWRARRFICRRSAPPPRSAGRCRRKRRVQPVAAAHRPARRLRADGRRAGGSAGDRSCRAAGGRRPRTADDAGSAVAAWGEALKGAIRQGRPRRAARDRSERAAARRRQAPRRRLSLAGDLAALIDDMRIEGVGFERLSGIVADDFDPYWRITLDFLKIAFEAWPAWLAERGLADRAERTAERRRARDRSAGEADAARRSSRARPAPIAPSRGSSRAVARAR